MFSATGPVIAVVRNELFVGEAAGPLEGAGWVAIHSQKDPDLIHTRFCTLALLFDSYTHLL
jgi:hypothetical protein